MLPTRLLRVVVVALATVLVACGDPTRSESHHGQSAAQLLGLRTDGAPAATANAINLFIGPARADASFAFDVALDLDADREDPRLSGARRRWRDSPGLPTRVGLQTVTGSFESVREAPDAATTR